ncbi:MAG: acyltransferase family protein [Sphingomonas sp.]
MASKDQLPAAFSLYLDVLRFTAAVAVYVNHIAKYPFVPAVARGAPLSLYEQYGAPAVTVFFVLSGYVIAYVVATRERDARSYAISRLSRLYSVVIPALLLTLLLDSWGQWLDPALYAEHIVSPKPMTAGGYAASSFLINEFQAFGFHGIGPGSNGPWWSLSFEAAYYLVAGMIMFARPRVAIILALVVFAVAGRTIVALAPLWALGFFLYRWRDALAHALPLPLIFWLASIVAIAVIPWLLPSSPAMNFGLHFPWARQELNRNLAQDYAVAIAVAVHLVAAHKLFGGAIGTAPRAVAVVRFLGAMTFPLYAMHRPAMFFLAAISPWPQQSAATIIGTTLAIGLGVGLVTPLCDRLKRWLRDMLGTIWPTKEVPLPQTA